MSQQARNEAKRLRRLKRKQDSGSGAAANSISATGITIVGGGTLAVIAIALGVNALSPDEQKGSNQGGPTAPLDSSQSLTPSASASKESDYVNGPTSGVSGSFKISITASPTASPSLSPSPTTSPSSSPSSPPSPTTSPSSSPSSPPSPTASTSPTPSPTPSSPGVAQGSYFAEGRYGAGYYSTAYNVALSSPGFMAGSGSYYGTSGYDAAIDSPNGYYSQGGWNGSGFYETGYFDFSANYAGTWDGTGITHQYGSGAYFGISGFSSAQLEPQGSYFPSGYFGSGHYTQVFFDYSEGDHRQGFAAGTGSYYGVSGLDAVQNTPRGYRSLTGNYGAGYYESGYLNFSGITGSTIYWNGQSVGTGAYYGESGYSDPIYGVRGSYYSSGIAGSGYYASLFTGNYSRYSGGTWDYLQVNRGIGTYYGLSGISSPITAPSGSYYITGFAGEGYYGSGYFACGYGYVSGATEMNVYYGSIGRRTYYGLNSNATPLAGPEGIYKYDGFRGTGYYEPDPNDMYDAEYRFGTGSYYGTSGYGTPIAPPTGMQWYYSGWGGSGFYSSGQTGTYWFQGNGTGDYYGSSGYGTPQAPPSGSYYSSGWTGAGYYATSECPPGYWDSMMGYCYGSYQGGGTYYGLSGYSAPQAAPSGSFYSAGYAGSGFYATGYNNYIYYTSNQPSQPTVGAGTYFGATGYDPAYSSGPLGSFFWTGYAGSGYYASGYFMQLVVQADPAAGYIGSGTYYGVSGETTLVDLTSGRFYLTGEQGRGYYESGFDPNGLASNGQYIYGATGVGAYYGLSGTDSPLTPA